MVSFKQISRRQRKHAMVLRQAKKFGPVHGRQIAIGNAFATRWSHIRAGEVAQKLEFVASLG